MFRLWCHVLGVSLELLRIDYDAGHGIGSSVSPRANELADQWSFALWPMGLAGDAKAH